MKANKSTGTKPELLLAKTLWHMGCRYRKNDKSITGKPDLCFKKYKIAVFVDGEFWHGKDWEIRKNDIQTNRDFWINKIERNIKRDIENNTLLQQQGWQVFRFWGRDIIKNPTAAATQVTQAIYEKQHLSDQTNRHGS